MVGEPAHQLVRTGGVASLALDVEEERNGECRPRLHAASQNLKSLGTVEEGKGTCPDRALGAAEQLFVHPPSVPSMQAWHLGPGPYKIGFRSPGCGLSDRPKPGGGG